jgi:hypothetical protein
VEQVALREAPFHRRWGTDEEIHRELSGYQASNLHRLIQLIPRRHNDQDVDVAVRVGRAISVRAKQDDLLRLKPLGNLASKTTDHAHGDIRPSIPAGRPTLGHRPGIGFHALIVPGVETSPLGYGGIDLFGGQARGDRGRPVQPVGVPPARHNSLP